MVTMGIDIGGTNLRAGTVSRSGELGFFERHPQQEVLAGEPVSGLSGFVKSYLERHSLHGKVQGLTVGLPATLNREKTRVLNAPNLEGLDGMELGSLLEDRLQLPVFLLKDVSALFYYDRMRFGLGEASAAIACYVGTGIGNAICIGGQLYDGANGVSGELGHIPVWDFSEPCGCGNRGCMELCVGGKYLAQLQREQFRETPVEELFVRHAGHPLLRRYVERLAVPIATEINILDPQVVILGGGVVSMREFPTGLLEEEVRGHARKPLPESGLRFLISRNQGENGVIGAGIYTWERLWGKGAGKCCYVHP